MSNDEIIFAEEERAEHCIDGQCSEHGDGDRECQIPKTKQDITEDLDSRKTSRKIQIGQAEPKTATADVVRSGDQ